jgi:hypothetical protein
MAALAFAKDKSEFGTLIGTSSEPTSPRLPNQGVEYADTPQKRKPDLGFTFAAAHSDKADTAEA